MCYQQLNQSLPKRDMFSGFGLLIPQFISDSSNRCMEKEMRIQKSKGHFLLLSYARLDCQCDYKPIGMCSWAAHPSCPDTWPLCSWAGVWLSASGKAQPRRVLSKRSMNNSQRILGGMLALTTSSVNSLKHCFPLFHRPERNINI